MPEPMDPDRAPSTQAARDRAQAALDAERGAAARNRDGQFATPSALAAQLVAMALEAHGPGPVALLEPSVGTGALVSALLEAGAPVEAMLGVERDARFVAAARALWGGRGLELRCADFLALPAEPRFSLLLANPPYVRHHHLDAETKARLRAAAARLGVAASGLMGLYGYFLLLGGAWLRPGGAAAWLIPAEILDVDYGTNVRAFLAERWTVLRVHRADPRDPLFGDALVSSALLTLQNAPPPPGHAVRFTAGGSPDAPASEAWIPQARLGGGARWPPVEPGEGERLGDHFLVRRGLVTGGDAFFVRRDPGELPTEHLRPLLPSPRHLRADEVRARPDGGPDLPAPRWLLDCDLPPERVEAEHPAIWALLAGAPVEVRHGYLCSRRSPWYRQERRAPPPIVVSYMGRGERPFRFVRNRSRAVAGNTWLCLYPRQPMSEAELDGWWRRLSALPVEALTRIGRVYGGGLHKLEPGELLGLRVDRG